MYSEAKLNNHIHAAAAAHFFFLNLRDGGERESSHCYDSMWAAQ